LRKIADIVFYSKPDELGLPPPSEDHAGHITYLTMKGYTKIAADHLLHTEMKGHLRMTVGNVTRQLSLAFNQAVLEAEDEKGIVLCSRVYDALVNMALNLFGMEKNIVGFSSDEVEAALDAINAALRNLEAIEQKGIFGMKGGQALIAKVTVDGILSEMKKVMKGFYRPPGSMVAHTAEEIEKHLNAKAIMESFLKLANQQIQENIYYKIGAAGMCKFGNDYALGLRWLRHLGFVQVSTNPSLAAIAYDDDPSQWQGYRGENLCPDFKTIAREHPELFMNPEDKADEIVTYATEVSIWRNLTVFRPIAVSSDMRHGMISLQLNPNIADNYEESVRLALKFYKDAEEFLRKYDAYLLWGYSENVERGRPNIVFKVAGSSSASIEITRKLESLGIGTNNTVTFTVSQEVELILAKIDGRAEAAKKGFPLTTVYETNMGGRLDDYLREVQAEKLIQKALVNTPRKEDALKNLAERLGAWDEAKKETSLDKRIVLVSSRKYLRPLNKQPMIEFLAENGVPSGSKEKAKAYLESLEHDIQHCGILVTKRVYEIFFSPQNKPKWISYIQTKYELTKSQAEEVIGEIDVLPASKRHPRETLLTLAGVNMTHTEFPNHQSTVVETSHQEGFDIKDYDESVLKPVDPAVLQRVTSKKADINDLVEEFYELTKEQRIVLKEAGIVELEKYGTRGLESSRWRSFGSTVKTMEEFSNSYGSFKEKCIEFIHKISKEK
jgi:tetratricopeptide (TPR) repeat protein